MHRINPSHPHLPNEHEDVPRCVAYGGDVNMENNLIECGDLIEVTQKYCNVETITHLFLHVTVMKVLNFL